MARSVSFDVLAIDKASKALSDVAREVTQLDERIDRAGGSIEVDADVAKAQQQLRQVDAQLARLNAKSFKVDADTQQAERQLQVLRAELEKTTDAGKRVKIEADISQVQAQLRRLSAEKVAIDVETGTAQAKVAALDASISRTLGGRHELTVDVDAALASVGELSTQAAQLWAKRNKLTLDVTEAEGNVRRLAVEIASVTDERRKIELDLQMGAALAEVALLKGQLRDVEKTRLDVDASGALAKLAQLGTQMRAVQTPAALAVGFASVMEAVAWVQRLAAGLASLGAVGVISGGVAVAAFKGIGDALGEMDTKATSAGGSVSASASSIRSAVRQVEAAQRDLRDANENVTRSEESLVDAQKDAQRAVESLDDARRAAIRTLEDYELRSKGMALSQESADLAIAEAQQRLAEVEKDKNATSLERARAELSVREAIQRRNEVEVEGKRLAEDKTAADAKGVEGSNQVVSAQERIADANKRVEEAQRDLSKSHEAVTLATQRLSDSQLALQEAMHPPGGGGGTTVDKLAEAMKKLTPEGQAFVRFLDGLIKGPLKDLQDTAQSKFLPGLQDGIQSAVGNLGTFRQSVAVVATEFGDFFRDIGPSAGRAVEALGRLAGLGADTTFEGIAGAVNRALDSFTEWANSQSAADVTSDIKEVGQSIVELKNIAETSFKALQLAWETLRTAASFANPFSNVVEQMGRLYEAFRKVADLIPGFSGKLPPASELLKDLGNSGSVAVPQIDHVGTSSTNAANAIQRMQDAARASVQAFTSSEQANLQYAASIDRASESLQANGATLSIHTEKGRANRQALLDMAQAANGVIQTMENANAPTAQVSATFDQQRQKLIAQAQQFGLTKSQAQAYIDKLLEIPASKTTNIIANTTAALSGVKAVSQAISQLSDKTVTIRTVYSSGSVTSVKAQAVGGWVPGSPSEVDTEHYMLARGEFIVRSSQAKRWGPLLEAINDGRDPSAAAGTEQAGGGTMSSILAPRPAPSSGVPSLVVNVAVNNAVVGNNDELSRVVSTAVREGITRGYLPASALAG